MATLTELRPNSDITETELAYSTGTEAFSLIDDDPQDSGQPLGDWVGNSTLEVNAVLVVGLTSVNSDFGNMETLGIRTYVSSTGTWVDDTNELTAKVTNAGGTVDYTNSVQVAIFNSATGPSGLQDDTFTLTSSGATVDKAAWDAAELRFDWTYTKTKSGDNIQIQIDATELYGTYSPGAQTFNEDITLTTNLSEAETSVATFPTSLSLSKQLSAAFNGICTFGVDIQLDALYDAIHNATLNTNTAVALTTNLEALFNSLVSQNVDLTLANTLSSAFTSVLTTTGNLTLATDLAIIANNVINTSADLALTLQQDVNIQVTATQIASAVFNVLLDYINESSTAILGNVDFTLQQNITNAVVAILPVNVTLGTQKDIALSAIGTFVSNITLGLQQDVSFSSIATFIADLVLANQLDYTRTGTVVPGAPPAEEETVIVTPGQRKYIPLLAGTGGVHLDKNGATNGEGYTRQAVAGSYPSRESFSACAWFRSDANTTWRTVFSLSRDQTGSTSDMVTVYAHSGNVGIWDYRNSNQTSDQTVKAITLNVWYYVGVTVTDDGTTLYVRTMDESSFTTGSTTNATAPIDFGTIGFGCNTVWTGEGFDGELANGIVFDRELSEAEHLKQSYQFKPIYPAWEHHDLNSTVTASRDLSGNNRTLNVEDNPTN
jgi:hypothetical protein